MNLSVSMKALDRFTTGIQGLDSRETLKLGTDTSILKDGKLRRLSSNCVRSTATMESNNAVRSKFLASLGSAYGLSDCMHLDDHGTAVFTQDFMNKLKESLGDKVLKSADFAIDPQGYVRSGKPLTVRRVHAILGATEAKALIAVRFTKAADNITERLFAMLNSNDITISKAKIRTNFGSTREEIRTKVVEKLKENKFYNDFLGITQLPKTFIDNFKRMHELTIRKQFTDSLKRSENQGFHWEMLRTGRSIDRFKRITINGQSVENGQLSDSTPEYRAAQTKLKGQQDWDQGFSPSDNQVTERFCTALKAKITNPTILKVITSQLGIQGVSGTISSDEAPNWNVPLDMGNGHDLRQFQLESLSGDIFSQLFTGDAATKGTVDIQIENNQVVLTQKFPIGFECMKLGKTLIQPNTMCPVTLPLFTATSKITIPLNQDLAYGDLPQYKTEVNITNEV